MWRDEAGDLKYRTPAPGSRAAAANPEGAKTRPREHDFAERSRGLRDGWQLRIARRAVPAHDLILTLHTITLSVFFRSPW